MLRKKSKNANDLNLPKNSKFKDNIINTPSLPVKEEIPVINYPSSGAESQSSQDSGIICSESINQELSKVNILKKALALNIQVRQQLMDQIKKIKKYAKRNLEKQAFLKEIIADDKLIKASTRPPSNVRAISVFAAPYFRDAKKMIPPQNEDAIIKMKNRDVNAYLNPPRLWLPVECRRLKKGITTYALMSALKPYQIKRNHLKNKLLDKNLGVADEEMLLDQLADTEQIMKNISEKPLEELLNELEGKIDWMVISSVDLEGTRTPEDCEYFWNNIMYYKINKGKFTPFEDEKLKDLAMKYSERDWDRVAKYLKTNRTAFQCFDRYQNKLNSNLTKRYWTPEEDTKLIDLIKKMRYGGIIPWNKISMFMDGRTRQQIINRYERSISQSYNRGPWTPEEDAILYACVQKCGFHWAEMRPYFRRRSTYSIRERYVNALDPCIKMGSWTMEEDLKLISLIRKYGYGKWAKICKHVSGRTDNMCLVRAGRLLAHSVAYHLEKKGVEYDTTVFDPELFARILRPIAPTKYCRTRNLKLRSDRENAIDTFIVALRRVAPSIPVEGEDMYSYDFSFLSHDTLYRVSEELHRMLNVRESLDEPFLPNVRYLKKEPAPNKRLFPEASDIDSEEEEMDTMPIQFTLGQKQWLEKVLLKLFEPASKVLPPSRKKTILNLTRREDAESTLYKAYLYKNFICKAPCDEDDDLEDVVFNEVDYSESMQTVVSYFMQPPVYDKQFIVMAPNMTTLGAMEYIEATEEQLKSMSELIHYSNSYIEYISERNSISPSCLQCLHAKGVQSTSQVTPEIMFTELKEKLYIVDDDLEKDSYVESACLNLCPPKCCCTELEKSRNLVRRLRQRCMGVCMWPSLLSSIKFNEEQDNILLNPSNTDADKDYFMRTMERGRPPGSKNKVKPFNKKIKLRKGRPHKSSQAATSAIIPKEENLEQTTLTKDGSVEIALAESFSETEPTVKSSEIESAKCPMKTEVIENNTETTLQYKDRESELLKNFTVKEDVERISEDSPVVNSSESARLNIIPAAQKVKKQCKRKFPLLPETEIRRSKRSCVVKRTCFSYREDFDDE